MKIEDTLTWYRFYVACENHEWLYRLTLPYWWLRCKLRS